jgi:hypothetical protein
MHKMSLGSWNSCITSCIVLKPRPSQNAGGMFTGAGLLVDRRCAVPGVDATGFMMLGAATLVPGVDATGCMMLGAATLASLMARAWFPREFSTGPPGIMFCKGTWN